MRLSFRRISLLAPQAKKDESFLLMVFAILFIFLSIIYWPKGILSALLHSPRKMWSNVVKSGECKSKDPARCLIISNLQGLIRASGGNTNILVEIIDCQSDIIIPCVFTETILKHFCLSVSFYCALFRLSYFLEFHNIQH